MCPEPLLELGRKRAQFVVDSSRVNPPKIRKKTLGIRQLGEGRYGRSHSTWRSLATVGAMRMTSKRGWLTEALNTCGGQRAGR